MGTLCATLDNVLFYELYILFFLVQVLQTI